MDPSGETYCRAGCCSAALFKCQLLVGSTADMAGRATTASGVSNVMATSAATFGLKAHEHALGRVPRLVAADAAFYSGTNEVRPMRRASRASAFPINTRRAPSENASRRNDGSRTGRGGAPGVRDASAS